MNTALLVSFPALGLLALAACSAPAATEEGASRDAISGGQCDIEGPSNRADLDDPFFKNVLDVEEAGATCPNDVKGVLARLKAKAGTDASVFVVSENSDKASDKTGYRFVLSQATATTKADEMFLSLLGSKAGVSGGFVEAMGWSPKKGGYNYYHLVSGGRWELAGNGADAKVGAAPAFECIACHTSGGPLMKEQQDSWANWNSNWFNMPAPTSSDAVFNDLFSKKMIADSLETTMVAGERRHAKARTDRELATNLKGLLKQVMCEVAEPNLVASHSRNSDRHASISSFPGTVGSVFITQMFGHDFRQRNYKDLMSLGLGSVDIRLDGAGYAAALTSSGMTVPTDSGPAKDAMFPMLTPERGFADNLIIEELLERKILDKDLVADLLMTDFTVPSYSKTRCALAGTAPNKGATPDEIRAAWAANLASSQLLGAAELKARLEKPDDFAAHTATVKAYVAACNGRVAKDALGFMEDTLRVVAQRRVEFAAQYPNIVESRSLLPEATKWNVKAGAVRFDPTDCTLKGK